MCIVTPSLADANNGNWQTARRWARLLAGHYRVVVVREWPEARLHETPAALIALHARRSAASVAAWAKGHPLAPLVVVLTGGLLALVTVLRNGAFGMTMHRVLQILVGLLPGWQMPKFSVPADRRLTIPYGAAITIGAIIATAIFHA